MMRKLFIILLLTFLFGAAYAVTIHGVFHAKNRTLDKVSGRGIAWLFDSKVKGDVKISGVLVSKNTKILGDVFLNGEYAELDNTTVNNIQITNTVPNKKAAKIVLSGNTKIKGNVTFKGQSGQVILGPSVQFFGKINNGQSTRIRQKDN